MSRYRVKAMIFFTIYVLFLIVIFLIKEKLEGEKVVQAYTIEETNKTTYMASEIELVSLWVSDIKVTPQVREKANPQHPEIKPLGTYTVTAYCPCRICCGKWADNRPNGKVVGSKGVELKEGFSVASSLPDGVKIKIDGLGIYEVHDTPSTSIAKKYDNKIIDVYFENHQEAKEFGRQYFEVYEIVEVKG